MFIPHCLFLSLVHFYSNILYLAYSIHIDRPIEFVRELFKSTPNLNNKDRTKGPLGYGMMGHFYSGTSGLPPPQAPTTSPGGHIRSTSYSISYGRGKPLASPTADIKGKLTKVVPLFLLVSFICHFTAEIILKINTDCTPLPSVQPEMRGRSGTDVDSRMRHHHNQHHGHHYSSSASAAAAATNLARSRSAQSLKQLADQSSADDKMTVCNELAKHMLCDTHWGRTIIKHFLLLFFIHE